MDDFTYHIAVLKISFFIPSAQSLKSKRTVLKSLKDRVRQRFNVSIAELDGQDKWQRAVCGITMIGSDRRYMDSRLQNIMSFVETIHDLEIFEQEIIFL